VRFRPGARLDTGQVSDRRGRGGAAPIALGGGVGGLLLLLLLVFTGGEDPTGGLVLGSGPGGAGQSGPPPVDLSSECRTGADANQRDDCRIVGVVNSVQAYWGDQLDGYAEAVTVFFEGQTPTGCGTGSSATGPFYCPADSTIYIDLGFYDLLRSRFGASGGPFAEAYVIAHEYGHHVQNLTGTLERARDRTTGPDSSSVRVELQADCLAGAWAGGAVDTGYIEPLTDADIRDGLDAAASIGDDRIQEATTGRVDPESFSHGSSEQRQRWFLVGYGSVDPLRDCDTFATDQL